MARAEYKTIIAPKPVVAKIERYRRRKGYPSNGQALAALAEEVEKLEVFRELIENALKHTADVLEGIKGNTGRRRQREPREAVASLAKLIHSVLEQIELNLNPKT